MIKEVIVVEGKDDITAIKNAEVEAEIMATNGFGYNKKFVETLKKVAKRRGIIIFTDPDFVGMQIRRDLSSKIPNCKHAFLPQSKSTLDGDIGIENASKEDIIEALKKARPVKDANENKNEFTNKDMLELGLSGHKSSKEKRDKLGDILGIGYGNSKQFLNRLNSFGITRSELDKALERIKD